MKTILKGLLRAVAISAALWSVSAKAQTIYPGTAIIANNSETHFYEYVVDVLFTYINEDGMFEYTWQQVDTQFNGPLMPLEEQNLYDAAVFERWTRWGEPVPEIAFIEMYLNSGYYFQIPASAPTSGTSSAYAGISWAPQFSGGIGIRQNVWCVAGYTNWGTGAWTPPAPGTYTFYVGGLPLPGYSTNEDDPLIGKIQVNYTAYLLVVN